MYGVEFAFSTPLYDISTSTGAASAIGPNADDNIGDLTSDTRAGSETIWGVRIASNELVTFDPSTGLVTSRVTMDSADKMTSLAFDPVSGVLYGNTTVGFGAAFDALYSIDPTTGGTTFIGRILFSNVFALGFDQSGNLYGVSDATSELIEINTTTGNGTSIAALRLSSIYDIASDPDTDIMYATSSATTSLYTIDVTNGALSLIGPHGGGVINMVGLAFGAGIPAPATAALFLAGLAGLRIGRRRA